MRRVIFLTSHVQRKKAHLINISRHNFSSGRLPRPAGLIVCHGLHVFRYSLLIWDAHGDLIPSKPETSVAHDLSSIALEFTIVLQQH